MVRLLIYFLILILPLGQLTRLPLNGGEIGVYLHDGIIVLLILSWGLSKILKKEKIIWPQLTKFIFAFAAWAAFSLLLATPYFSKREILIASLYFWRWLAYSGIYFISKDIFKNGGIPHSKFSILNLLILAGFLASIFGLLQYLFFPDIRSLTQYNWDPHYFRVVGTFLDPGFTGLIYVLTLTLLVQKLWSLRPRNIKSLILGKNLFWLMAGIIIYLALALTYARSAYLAYLAAMAVLAWYKKAAKFFIVVLLWAVITLDLLPRPGGEGVRLERQSTILARLNNYQQTIKIGWQKPLFGWGFSTYRYVQRNLGFLDRDDWQKTHAGAGADSSLLFVFASTGVFGLISYIFLFYAMLKSGESKAMLVASLTAVLSHSFFNNSLFYGWIMIWLWLILSLDIKESTKQ